jgi:hypothetical protein
MSPFHGESSPAESSSRSTSSSYLEFVSTGGHGDGGIFQPMWGMAPKAGEITHREKLFAEAERMSEESRTLSRRALLPDDHFIRYYYASLSILGLYIVFRLLEKYSG